jgi:hypothetical protein
MASQPIEPQPGDVADEHGRFAPIEPPEGEAAGAAPGATTDIRSGSHLTEDDTGGGSSGSRPGAEHPPVGQPVNVTQPRRP